MLVFSFFFLQIMTDPIALKIVITFGNLGPPSFNKDGSARPPADVAASGRSRLRALRTKLLAQITDRVMAVSRSTIAVRNRVHDGKQETVLLKYLLAMRVVRPVERRSVDFCHLTPDNQYDSIFPNVSPVDRREENFIFIIDKYQNYRKESIP